MAQRNGSIGLYCLLQSLLQIAQHLGGMILGDHRRIGPLDPPVGSDQVADSPSVDGVPDVAGAARHSQLPPGVAQEPEREVEFAGEGSVCHLVVEAGAEDDGVERGETVGEIAEPATLGRSPGGVRLRVEPEDDTTTAKIGQAKIGAIVCAHDAVGSEVFGFEHRSPPRWVDVKIPLEVYGVIRYPE